MKSTYGHGPARAMKQRRLERQVQGGAAGALAGASVGAFAGPPGVVVGAVVGAIAGAVTVLAVEHSNAVRSAAEHRLDQSIGIFGGDLGSPYLKQPASKRGPYSIPSMGVESSADSMPAEGAVPSSRG